MTADDNSRSRVLAAITIGCAALAAAVGSLANSTGVKLHEWIEPLRRPMQPTLEEPR